jgi:hypothetical protein
MEIKPNTRLGVTTTGIQPHLLEIPTQTESQLLTFPSKLFVQVLLFGFFPPYLSALGKNWWQSLAFDAMASATNSTMFVTLAPNDLCWGGYQYPILGTFAHNQNF